MKFQQTCCSFSKSQLEYYCEQHGDMCPDQVLRYLRDFSNNFDFFLIATNATYLATYCPSCGNNLKETCIPEKTY